MKAAIARQKLQDYYAQRDAARMTYRIRYRMEEKFSDSSEFDDPRKYRRFWEYK